MDNSTTNEWEDPAHQGFPSRFVAYFALRKSRFVPPFALLDRPDLVCPPVPHVVLGKAAWPRVQH